MAKKILNEIYFLEEKFEALFMNFEELEREILNVTWDCLKSLHIEPYRIFQVTRARLNLRLLNFLSTSRLYRDAFLHCSKHFLAIENPKKFFSDEYDSSFSYRFLEELRNHIQHRGDPIHEVSFRGFVSETTPKSFGHTISLFSLKDRLIEDEQFKKNILGECQNEIDLKYCCRDYMNSYMRIHAKVREVTNKIVDDSRNVFEFHVKRFNETYGGDNLIKAISSENNKEVESFSVLLEYDDIRKELVQRNCMAFDLTKHYLSSEIRGHNT